MNELNDNILEDDLDHRPDTLPQFLNVLTILTFVGSGLSFLGAIYNLATIEQQAKDIAEVKAMAGNTFISLISEETIKGMELMLENVYLLQGSAMVIALLCILGAYMMRKLQKNGFYIYLAASIASVAIPLSVVGVGFVGGIILGGSVITAAFVIMYGVNFKYLR